MGLEVLLVDDETVFSDVTSARLSQRGFSVAVASSGEEALEKVRSKPPDAIVLDIKMPGISGFEVLKRLKADQQTQAIPVIVCSVTCNDQKTIRELKEAGARDFVQKPCDPDHLAVILREAAGGSAKKS